MAPSDHTRVFQTDLNLIISYCCSFTPNSFNHSEMTQYFVIEFIGSSMATHPGSESTKQP